MLKDLGMYAFAIATALAICIAFKAGKYGIEAHEISALVGSCAMVVLALVFGTITARLFTKWVKQG